LDDENKILQKSLNKKSDEFEKLEFLGDAVLEFYFLINLYYVS